MESRFRSVFGSGHVLLPVVHVESKGQALRNARIAHAAGCDGVFLINHSTSHADLMSTHAAVADDIPEWWVGVNSLGSDPAQLFGVLPESVAGLWVDNAGIDERSAEQLEAGRVDRARLESGWGGLYFGGVAFKYQRQVADVSLAARAAGRYMDVITTSGSGTGTAASPEKVAAMKTAAGDHPLAIASGITPDNVVEYLDVADCFLVATGISRSFTELDPRKVDRLVAAVRSAGPE